MLYVASWKILHQGVNYIERSTLDTIGALFFERRGSVVAHFR